MLDGVLLDLRSEDGKRWYQFERSDDVSVATYERFLSALTPLLLAGANLTTALGAVEQSTSKNEVLELTSNLRSRLNAGELLSQAVRRDGGAGEIVGAFIAAGEKGAGISFMCEEALSYLKTNSLLRKEIENALAYPIFVIMMAIVAFAVLAVLVAPEIAPLLQDSENGSMILMLSSFGSFLRDHFSTIMLSTAAVTALSFALRKQLRLGVLCEVFLLSVPIFKDAYKDWRCAPVARTMGSLLSAGMSFNSAIEASSSVAKGAVKSDLLRMNEAMKDGVTLGVFLRNEKTQFPERFTRLILVSDAVGNLEMGFQQAGELCQASAISRIKKLSSILGPTVVVVIGGFVAVLMLSFMSGLLSLSEGIS